jgi:hypothetical protein
MKEREIADKKREEKRPRPSGGWEAIDFMKPEE